MGCHHHFRMHRTDFEALCNWIGPLLPKERTISTGKKNASNPFRGIGDRFNLSKGSLRRVVRLVCHTLVSHKKKWIKWPSPAEMHENASQFQERAGFPGVIGALDGTHVKITATKPFCFGMFMQDGQIPCMMHAFSGKAQFFIAR